MNRRRAWLLLLLAASVFAAFFFWPLGSTRFDSALTEGLALTQWYLREHVILCLLPAFWIAGAIGAFVSQQAVLRHFGPAAPKTLSYGIASVSGSILAVCSCTVLPLFSGIHRMGAGLGPAAAFLYSGPSINAVAIILTAKVLGLQLGVARAVGAIVFSIAIGLTLHGLFRRKARPPAAKFAELPPRPAGPPLGQTAAFFGILIALLVFANWSEPGPDNAGFFAAIGAIKWPLTAALAAVFGWILWRWFALSARKLAATGTATAAGALLLPAHPEAAALIALAGLVWCTAGRPDAAGAWFDHSWTSAKQILPLLVSGVFIAGFLFGRPGHEGLIPSDWIAQAVGGNSLAANALAAVAGTLMYFATLTEIPILQGLLGSGMGQGPALTLLLAGPAVSLPSIIVLHSILGPTKTVTYVALVVFFSTFAGWGYGALTGS
jgi:uncharacterized membrane protein YraQ (UPF0718 family)